MSGDLNVAVCIFVILWIYEKAVSLFLKTFAVRM